MVLGLTASALADDGFVAPARGDVTTSGSAVEVRWTTASKPAERELVLSLDGGLTFPIRISSELSPRSASFRWSVPDLPTSRARLALRSGSGEGNEDEALEFLSGEFTIVSAASGGWSELTRGANEWWTRQALLGVSAEDLLAEAMRGPSEQLVVPDSSFDINEPDPPAAPAQRLAGARLDVTGNGLGAAFSSAVVAHQAVALPLRL